MTPEDYARERTKQINEYKARVRKRRRKTTLRTIACITVACIIGFALAQASQPVQAKFNPKYAACLKTDT